MIMLIMIIMMMMMIRLEESFKATLQQQASLESWAGWLEGVAESILR